MPVEKPRPYQIELYEEALKRNVIAFLETGSGKTLISIILLEHFARELKPVTHDDILKVARSEVKRNEDETQQRLSSGSAIENGDLPEASKDTYSIDSSIEIINGVALPSLPKKVVFCVPTVPLVSQQAQKIRQNTNLSVGEYSRDDSASLSHWDALGWFSEVSLRHVLVFTPQIFLNVLRHGFLNLSKHVSLLIFDEAHHAFRNHPYNLIMKEFYHPCREERPKIFGMTASPVCQRTSTKQGSIYKIAELQRNLDSSVVTILDRKSLLAYVPRTREFIIEFPQTFMKDTPKDCEDSLKTKGCLFVKFYLDSLRAYIREIPRLESEGVHWINTVNAFQIELGPWAAGICARRLLQSSISKIRRRIANKVEDVSVSTIIERTKKAIDQYTVPKFTDIGPSDVSPKCWALVDLVKRKRLEYSQNSDFRGMIFVDRRTTATVISDVLNAIASDLFLDIKCAFVTGHGSSGSGEGNHKMSSSTQKQFFKRFREGSFNLLVVTRVAEEGIDIPACKIVIIFDLFRSNTGYIQSRGRARDMLGSEYYIFIRRYDERTLDTLSQAKISERLTRNAIKTIASQEPLEFLYSNDSMDNQFAENLFGASAFVRTKYAVINQGAAESVLGRYLKSKLSPSFLIEGSVTENDQSLSVHFDMLREQGSLDSVISSQRELLQSYGMLFGYVASLDLPVLSKVIKVCGFLRCTRKLAVQSAALEAVRFLYVTKALNENLLPSLREKKSKSFYLPIKPHLMEEDTSLVDYFNDETIKEVPKEVPKCFSTSSFWRELQEGKMDKGCDGKELYVSLIRLKRLSGSGSNDMICDTTSKIRSLLLAEENPTFAFAFITEEPPTQDIPSFSLYFSSASDIDVEILPWSNCCDLSMSCEPCNCRQSSSSYKSVSFSFDQLRKLKDLQSKLWALCMKPRLPKGAIDLNEEALKSFSERGTPFVLWDFLLLPMSLTNGRQTGQTDSSSLISAWTINNALIEDILEDKSCSLYDWILFLTSRLGMSLLPNKRLKQAILTDEKDEDIDSAVSAAYDFPIELDLSTLTSDHKRKRRIIQPNAGLLSDGIVSAKAFNDLLSEFTSFSEFKYEGVVNETIASKLENILQRTVVKTSHNNFKYFVEGIDLSITPNSSFTLSTSEVCTFKDYATRLGYEVQHSNSFMIRARQSYAIRSHLLKLSVKERPVDHQVIHLIPEVARVLPFAVDVLLTIHCLPSIMFRVASYALIDDLRHRLNLKGFSIPLMLEACTATTANEEYNYERLETLGDSFLKFAVSADLFMTYSNSSEGELSVLRNGKVSNQNLCRIAMDEGLSGFLILNPFRPNDFVVPAMALDSSGYIYREKRIISTKRHADFIEALLGCAVVGAGTEAARLLMQQMGLVGEITILRERIDIPITELQTSLQTNLSKLYQRLNYVFKYRCIAIEAITHPSYLGSITPSYERLEFLGDAIMDYLVMRFFFEKNSDYTSENLSDLRGATVNNEAFCQMSVSLGLEQLLLHSDKKLEEDITSYLKYSKTDIGTANDIANFFVEGPKALGDIFEALVAAVFIDSGCSLEDTWNVFSPIIIKYAERVAEPDVINKSPIRRMHEFFQKKGFRSRDVWCRFKVLFQEGVEIHICDIGLLYLIIATGKGNSRSLAKRVASSNALLWIEEHEGDIDDLLDISNNATSTSNWSDGIGEDFVAEKAIRYDEDKTIDAPLEPRIAENEIAQRALPPEDNLEDQELSITATFNVVDSIDSRCVMGEEKAAGYYSTQIQELLQRHREEELLLRHNHNRTLENLLKSSALNTSFQSQI
ncbi:hypothetical protein HDU67_008320 [Dinochytrium kinnereticum]|nr:hypothetical protein HDU67_008320 [Dinochytrium kinnereticum]